jgi:hypothetical protein
MKVLASFLRQMMLVSEVIMTANKKHHYVPRLLFKHFSEDDRNIFTYNIRRKQRFTASINNECYRDYLYGKQNKIENVLMKIENKAAPLLRLLVSEQRIVNCEQENVFLLLFISTMYVRTETVKQRIRSFQEYVASEAISKYQDRLTSHSTHELKSSVAEDSQSLFRSGVLRSLPSFLFYCDLRKCLLHSETAEIIFSDAPLVCCNHFFFGSLLEHLLGPANIGVQIFLPIGPNDVLLLYDSNVYQSNVEADVIPLSDDDVVQLNILQILSAEKKLYYKELPTNISNIVERQRDAPPIKRDDMGTIFDSNGKDAFDIFFKPKPLSHDINLSFLSLKQNPQHYLSQIQSQFSTKPIDRMRLACDSIYNNLKSPEFSEGVLCDILRLLDTRHRP